MLLDVTPLTLGVETLGGVSTPMIDANTTIPTSKTEVFSTAADGQTEVQVHVLQGNRPMAQDNRSLGRFNLTGIAAAPRGMPQIAVTFDIDRNGIISVSAKDKATNKEQSIRIEAQDGLSSEEIDRMKREAEEHAADDLKRAEVIKLRNQADNDRLRDRTPAQRAWRQDPRGRAQPGGVVDQPRPRSDYKGDDADAIKKALDKLMEDAQTIGKIVYEEVAKQQAAAGAAGGAPEGAAPPPPPADEPGDVIDAEYEVKDNK